MPPKSKTNYVRKAKNTVKKVANYVAKNPQTVSTGLSLAKVAYDVARLASMVNAEKKRLDISISGIPVGQVNINATGSLVADITPAPAQNVTYNGRVGSSIKLHSSFMQFQLWSQSLSVSEMRGKIEIFIVKGTPQALPGIINSIYEANTFSTVVDYNSERNPDYYGQYLRIYSKKFYLKQESQNNQTAVTSFKIPMKYFRGKGHHIRYDKNTSSITDGQMVLCVTMDAGNIAASASSLTVPVTIATSGALLSYDIKHYYYDN